MTTPTSTRHRGVYTVDPDKLPALLRSAAVTPTLAVADSELAARVGPLPQLPPGRLRDCVTAGAANAGVPEAAVMLTAVALLTESTAPLMPPVLAAVQLPATWIVGTEAQCGVVLAAAEAVVASLWGRAM